jgi:glucuronosyltransferase
MFPMIPDLSDLEQKTQILLTNSNPHVNFEESLPQSVIPVGGLQIARPKNLSQDLQTFVESAEKGFVLFSFGTNVKRHVLGKRFQMFYSALRQIKDYNFIWKLDGNDEEIDPAANVKIVPWLPQTDLLGHKNVRAFITHCGLLSIQEGKDGIL